MTEYSPEKTPSKKDVLEVWAKIGAIAVLGIPTMGMVWPALVSMDMYKYWRKRLKDELAKQNVARNAESISKQDIKDNMMQYVTAETQKEIAGLANKLDKQVEWDSKKETMSDMQNQSTQKAWTETSNALTQKKKKIPKGMDYRLTNPWELDEINNGSSDSEKIHLFESKTPTAEYYVIEDKIHHIAAVYTHGKSVLVVDTATGKKKGDTMTVTTKNGKGNNMSTPAGMFRISSTYIYGGKTSFQRSKIYEDYDIPSSVHIGYVPKDKNKCNISDGCTRISWESADKLSKYVTKNSRWYILPEEEKTGKFKINGNWISFVSNDVQKLHSEHAKGTRNMAIQIPKEFDGNKTLEDAVKSLESSKGVIVDKLNISSDTYDKLALLTLWIMGRESGYGRPGPRGQLGFLKDEIAARVFGRNVSAGPFQLRATSVPKDLTEKFQGNKKIDYNSLVDPSTSAQYTLLLLYHIYKYNAPKFTKKHPDLSLEEITLIYYTNPQGLKNPEKSQMRVPYAREVLENASKFKLNYQTPDVKSRIGKVEETLRSTGNGSMIGAQREKDEAEKRSQEMIRVIKEEHVRKQAEDTQKAEEVREKIVSSPNWEPKNKIANKDVTSNTFIKQRTEATKIPKKDSRVKLDSTPSVTWEQKTGLAIQQDSLSPIDKKEIIKKTQAKVIPNPTTESVPNTTSWSPTSSQIETVVSVLWAAKLNANNNIERKLNKTWSKDSLLKEEADAVIWDNDSTSIDIDDKTWKIVILRTGAATLDVSKLSWLKEIWSSSQSNKRIKGVDKLSHLTKLQAYFVTTFNFSEKNKTLEELEANSATTITGLENLTNLKVFKADAMTTLDVSKLTNLTRLDADSAKTLTDLENLTSLTKLQANALVKIDVSMLTNLKTLHAENAKTLIGIGNLANLESLSARNLTTGIWLDSFKKGGDMYLFTSVIWGQPFESQINKVSDIILSDWSKVDINHLEKYEYVGGQVRKK